MTAKLFSPMTVGGLELPNRIAVAPMCQYSADDGSATDWHLQHWMNLGMSGAGMVTLEMTDVERRGRISHGCIGLYSDHNEAAMKRALDAARAVALPGTKFGPQLAHAGRKASTQLPWHGGGPLSADEDAWQTVSASAIPFTEGWHTPRALEDAEVEAMIDRFEQAAIRARNVGFDFIELHGAHGYLFHQFLSPFSNKRTDRWGGSLENRMRFLVETTRRIRATVPELMLGVRLSVSEWEEGGFSLDEAVEVVKALKDLGVGYVCCSSGGNVLTDKIPVGPGYQVHLATAIRERTGMTVRAVGMITEPRQAEDILAEDKADIVALARAFQVDPRWPWRAAAALGAELQTPPQVGRAIPLLKRWEERRG